MRTRFKNRRAAAAVEAAVCLPVLVVIWFGSFELARVLSLKQQAQLFASAAATKVLETTDDFSAIEEDTEALAISLGIKGCEVSLSRVDSQIVESSVVIDFGQNSPLSSVLSDRPVTSTYYSYREE